MQEFLAQFAIQFTKSCPLFALIAVGYALSRWGGFSKTASGAVVKFAFNVSLTSMLFRLLAEQFKNETSADTLLLVAFFGAALIVLLITRTLALRCLKIDPVGAAVFGTGSVFSNNGLLGFPLAVVMLGDAYLPSIACVVTFNALILWTAVSILVEFSQNTRGFSFRTFLKSLAHVFRNPLILSIFAGALWNLTRIELPYVIDEPLRLLGASATPLSLIAVGMGLAEYGLGKGLGRSLVLTMVKLLVFPLAVFLLAHWIRLGDIETMAVVFLAGLPCGVNVYLMAREFHAIEAEIANAMLMTTLIASITMPLVVTVLRHTI